MGLRVRKMGGIIPAYIERGHLKIRFSDEIIVDYDMTDVVKELTFDKSITFRRSNIALACENDDYIFVAWFSGNAKIVRKLGNGRYRLYASLNFDIYDVFDKVFLGECQGGALKQSAIIDARDNDLYHIIVRPLKDFKDYAMIDIADNRESYIFNISEDYKFMADVGLNLDFYPVYLRTKDSLRRYSDNSDYVMSSAKVLIKKPWKEMESCDL